MRIFFTIFVCVLGFHSSGAQDRTISGRLTSTEDGSPLPGISITIKGTSIGTTTDTEGYYSIRVPIGSTLVFSFIGMQSREMMVTKTNLQPVQAQPAKGDRKRKRRDAYLPPPPPSLYQDSISSQTVGVSVLSDETPSYNTGKNQLDPGTIRSIKQRGRSYIIKTDVDPVRRTGFGLQFSTSLALDEVNKLPALQSRFSQGRTDGENLEWKGADQLEMFSWGPPIPNLEYNGQHYAFDRNGMLVPRGTGNGLKARAYNNHSFFRRALSNATELIVTLPTPKNGTLVFDIEKRTREGIIPLSAYKKLNVNTSLKNLSVAENLKANASIYFNRSTGDLLSRGSNLASIVASVYRTPATFDNANGVSSTVAPSSSLAYQLPDGTPRSHAPGITDNPYGLVNALPDQEELQRFNGSANLQYLSNGPISLVLNGSIDRQQNHSVFGVPPGYSGDVDGRLTMRRDHQTLVNGILTIAYRRDNRNGERKVSMSYQPSYSFHQLVRLDGFGFSASESFNDIQEADSLINLRRKVNRTAHEVVFNTHYQYSSWLDARITNRSYFSNTISSRRYANLFPSGSLSVDVADLLILWPLEDLTFYATASRTIREAPILFSGWAYGSIELPIEQYASFFEATELFSGNLAAETEGQFETGVKMQGGRFNSAVCYFNNLTRDFIAPVSFPEGFAPQNAATVRNYGMILSAGYTAYTGHTNWGIDLKWMKYHSVVHEINTTADRILLAGFQTANTVLAPGDPVGALYGTTYVRNADGMKLIGDDGFPIEDHRPKKIGNPIPDWTLGWSSFVEWKQLRLSALFDVKKGGDMWNGTNAVLDYLGRSANTSDKRGITDYIFEGIDLEGNANSKPVNFYHPEKPLADNRWVRYGWDGVGEDYIEDASWIRLSELALSYTSRHQGNASVVKDIKISFISRNLLLITPYSGVDPSTSLFGYAMGNGMDLFNLPSTRSYSLKVTVKI